MNKTKKRIFVEAKRLFETQGYYNTTVREITNAAGVNSGLFSYYFKNKYNLAVQMYNNIFQNILTLAKENFGDIENPAVFMGIMMRMHTYTINDEMAIKFTIDALKEGIFETSMLEKSIELIININKYYKTNLSREEREILLTTTLGVERSLITQNYLGRFHLDSKAISDNVLRSHLFNFGLKRKEIDKCITEVQKNFKKLQKDEPHLVNRIMNS